MSIGISLTSKERAKRNMPPRKVTVVEPDTGHVWHWTGAQWLQEFYILFKDDGLLWPAVSMEGCRLQGHARHTGLSLKDRFVRIRAEDEAQAVSEADRLFCNEYADISQVEIAGLRELVL